MNTDRAHVYGLGFKLQYYFPKRDQPHLQIFLNNERARSEKWEIYGLPPLSELWHQSQDTFRILEFEKLGQVKRFKLGRVFQIEFTGISEKEVDYRRIGKMVEPAYHFRLSQIDCDTS
jgi:hypothetical protein